MVLTKSELLASLHHEVHVLLHLIDKTEPSYLDYRPTEGQRSTMQLLRYLAVMAPNMVAAGATGTFDRDKWSADMKEAESMDLAQVKARIASHAEIFTKLVDGIDDARFRDDVEIFGRKSTRGQFFVRQVISNCVGYRMQLFLYLKACGRHELVTSNLWQGVDPAPKA